MADKMKELKPEGMNLFQHAAFWPFEVIFVDEIVGLLHWGAIEQLGVYGVILLAGIGYARYGSIPAIDLYNKLAPEKKDSQHRIPFVLGLAGAPLVVAELLKGCLEIGQYLASIV